MSRFCTPRGNKPITIHGETEMTEIETLKNHHNKLLESIAVLEKQKASLEEERKRLAPKPQILGKDCVGQYTEIYWPRSGNTQFGEVLREIGAIDSQIRTAQRGIEEIDREVNYRETLIGINAEILRHKSEMESAQQSAESLESKADKIKNRIAEVEKESAEAIERAENDKKEAMRVYTEAVANDTPERSARNKLDTAHKALASTKATAEAQGAVIESLQAEAEALDDQAMKKREESKAARLAMFRAIRFRLGEEWELRMSGLLEIGAKIIATEQLDGTYAGLSSIRIPSYRPGADFYNEDDFLARAQGIALDDLFDGGSDEQNAEA
jgi:hypothetical protein